MPEYQKDMYILYTLTWIETEHNGIQKLLKYTWDNIHIQNFVLKTKTHDAKVCRSLHNTRLKKIKNTSRCSMFIKIESKKL